MEAKQKSYNKAGIIKKLCYLTIALSVISCVQDIVDVHSLRYKGKIGLLLLPLLLPTWVVGLLGCLSWAGIYLLIKDYIQTFYQKQISLLLVVGILQISMGVLLLPGIESLGLSVLGFLCFIAFPIVLLIAGIQLNKIEGEKLLSVVLIIDAISSIVLVLLSLDSFMEETIPSWISILEAVIMVILLLFIKYKFDTKDEEEQKEVE
jgi:hypothetical protein